jgi:hypothetical protein
MFTEHERALSLAQEAESGRGPPDTSAVIERARAYLDFLLGTHDAAIISAARKLAAEVGN